MRQHYQKRVKFKQRWDCAHCHHGNATFRVLLRATPLMKPYLPSGSDSPQLPTESPGVPSLLCTGAGRQQEWRVHSVLRQRGGHGHLHMWTHVPVSQLRPAAPKAGTGLLSHLPAAHQGCYQDLQAVALLLARPRQGHLSEAPARWVTPWLSGSLGSGAICHLPLRSDEQGGTGVDMRP